MRLVPTAILAGQSVPCSRKLAKEATKAKRPLPVCDGSRARDSSGLGSDRGQHVSQHPTASRRVRHACAIRAGESAVTLRRNV